MKIFKKIILILLIILVFFATYLIVGGLAPYFSTPKISEESINQIEHREFYGKTEGVDRAAIIEDNEEALKIRLKMIADAKESIVLSTFDFRSDQAGLDMLSALYNAANRGVKVEIFADGFNSNIQMERNNYFYALSSHKNVKIIIYNNVNIFTPWKGLGRMHDKYVIADNRAYILGGRNTFGYFLGNYPGHKNYDRDVLVYNKNYKSDKKNKINANHYDEGDSSVYQVKKYYKDITSMKCCSIFHNDSKLAESEKVKKAAGELTDRYKKIKKKYAGFLDKDFDYEKNTYSTNKITLVSNPTTIYAKEPIVFQTLMYLAENAKEKVKIHTPYIISDDYMNKEFAKVGNKSEIMLNSVANNGNLFGAVDYMRHKKDIINTKMAIKEYDGGTSYHGKSMTIDDELAIVGSFNMDMRSAYIDTELMLVINSKDVTKQLVTNMEKYEKDSLIVKNINEYTNSDKIKPKEISKGKQRIKSWFGWLFEKLRFIF